MDTELYKKKIEILSRLVDKKELTLEEALLLLKNDLEYEKPQLISPLMNPYVFGSTSPSVLSFNGFTNTTI